MDIAMRYLVPEYEVPKFNNSLCLMIEIQTEDLKGFQLTVTAFQHKSIWFRILKTVNG